jgi:hypothetical protein
MKTETQAVADAFKIVVSADASYRGRWLLDTAYAAIIPAEWRSKSTAV